MPVPAIEQHCFGFDLFTGDDCQQHVTEVIVFGLTIRVLRINAIIDGVTVKESTTELQQSTLKEIAEMSLEAFWKQESRYINQVLHRLMGKKRFLLLDGEIIGVAEINRRQRSHA